MIQIQDKKHCALSFDPTAGDNVFYVVFMCTPMPHSMSSGTIRWRGWAVSGKDFDFFQDF